MDALRLEITARTEVLVGRWLCLDAILDAAMEIAGISEDERVLPLSGWTGTEMVPPGPDVLAGVRAGEMIYAASAVHVSRQEGFLKPFLQGHNKLKKADALPFVDGRGKPSKSIDTKRGPAAGIINYRQALFPGRFSWKCTGDGEGIRGLVESLEGIGAKTSMGYGRFHRPVDLSSIEDRTAGIVDEDGLLRPIPVWMKDTLDIPGEAPVRSMETVCPPYWRRDMSVDAIVPSAPYMSGLIA